MIHSIIKGRVRIPHRRSTSVARARKAEGTEIANKTGTFDRYGQAAVIPGVHTTDCPWPACHAVNRSNIV